MSKAETGGVPCTPRLDRIDRRRGKAIKTVTLFLREPGCFPEIVQMTFVHLLQRMRNHQKLITRVRQELLGNIVSGNKTLQQTVVNQCRDLKILYPGPLTLLDQFGLHLHKRPSIVVPRIVLLCKFLFNPVLAVDKNIFHNIGLCRIDIHVFRDIGPDMIRTKIEDGQFNYVVNGKGKPKNCREDTCLPGSPDRK